MHELGHNLGLRHGGNDNTNCKPNYISVMSYLFSLGQLVSNAPLDYSRSALATLNKGSLSEPNGISQSDPPGLTTIYGPRDPMQGPRSTQTGVPVDWNFNGVTTDTGVNSDISGGFGCGTPGPGPTLNGFNRLECAGIFYCYSATSNRIKDSARNATSGANGEGCNTNQVGSTR